MRARIVLSAVLLFLLPSSSWATDVIMDHVEFVREQGKPQTATTSFSACDPEGTFTLVVDNGQDGAHRVSSGTISVNGIPVVTQSDFNQQVSMITKPLMNIQESNQLEVLLASAPGSVIKVTITAQMICLALTIDSPAAGSTVSQDEVTVSGSVRHRTPEIGIKVNGVLAQVHGDRWIANKVPLAAGENVLTAVATDEKMRSVQSSIMVTAVEPTGPSLRLGANVEAGTAPLEVSFFLRENPGGTVSYELDFEGDGVVDQVLPTFDAVAHTYASEGDYFPSVTAVDGTGTRTASRMGITVYPLPPVISKWNKILGKLATGDVAGAMEFHTPSARDKYQRVYDTLGTDVPGIVTSFGPLEFVSCRGNVAEFYVRRTLDGEEKAFYVYFVRDQDGFWKLEAY